MGRDRVFFCGHLWERGKREKNEDSLAFWHMRKGKKQKILAIICDGIGGLKEGEQASGYVVRQMVNWFMTEGYKISRMAMAEGIMTQFCYQVHEEIKNYGKEKGSRLGTTMTLLFLNEKDFLWLHCGDSRLYLIRKGKVRKITRETCEKNGALNQAIGGGEWKLPAAGRGKLRKGDGLLLCTDGFYRNLSTDILQTLAKRGIYGEEQADRMLRQIYQKKIAMQETDNISAIYLGTMRKEIVPGDL